MKVKWKAVSAGCTWLWSRARPTWLCFSVTPALPKHSVPGPPGLLSRTVLRRGARKHVKQPPSAILMFEFGDLRLHPQSLDCFVGYEQWYFPGLWGGQQVQWLNYQMLPCHLIMINIINPGDLYPYIGHHFGMDQNSSIHFVLWATS